MSHLANIDMAHLFPPRLRGLAEASTMARPDPADDDALDSAMLEFVAELPFGDPFTFAEQYEGAMVHNAMPAQGHEQEQSSRGQVALRPHTDDGFLEPWARPEHLVLLGVSNPSRVPTVVIRIDDVVQLLSPETVEGLSRPNFFFPVGESFEVAVGSGRNPPARPIVSTREGQVEICLAPDTRVAANAEVSAADHLAALEEAVSRAPRHHFALGPGEVLIVSNTRCLHERPAVAGDRWIKRLYLRRSLRQLNQIAATDRPNVYRMIGAI